MFTTAGARATDVRVEVELDRSVGLEVVAHKRAEHLEHARRARAVIVDARSLTQSALVDAAFATREGVSLDSLSAL